MMDTAAMQDEFEYEEPIADSPVPTRRPSSNLAPRPRPAPAPAGSLPTWMTLSNSIYIGLGVASVVILIAAISNSQPKPAERIDPVPIATLKDMAPEILERNTEQQKKSLDKTNEAARQALANSDDAAVRKRATKYLLEAEKAIKEGDKQCLRSEIGRDCWLNIQEGLWANRLEQATLVGDADQMVAAASQLRSIEVARSGAVDLVKVDFEVIKLALRDRYNTRIDLLQSSANEKARILNKNRL